ncbi:MAG: C25 family cysteine peptidase, partial [Bacteroidota bacterium]
ASHTNPYYSLFTDTAAYFLTFNSTGGNERFTPVNNDLSNPPAAASFFMDRQVEVFSNKHLVGFNVDDLWESRFDVGEGWSSGFKRDRTIPVNLGPIATNGPTATVSTRVTSNIGTHDLSIDFNDVNYVQQFFNGYVINDFEFQVPASLMAEENTFSIEGAESSDVHSVSYVQIDYPHLFDFENQTWFEFPIDGSTNETYLEITNFQHNGTAPILFDLTNKIQIQTTLSGSTVRVNLPPSAADRSLVLVNQNASQTIDQSAIIPKNFTNYFTTTGDFIIISDDRMTLASDGSNPVQDYVDYRNSTGFDAIYINTQDIYDQFSYGIDRNLQGFRNFTHFSLKEWTATPPRYVLLLGKARTYKATRQNPGIALPIQTVPAFFGSDNLLVSNNTSDRPLIPIGRIAAYNPDEVALYLNKVQTFEAEQSNLSQTIEDRAWMKRIIHLGGGDQTIQTVIRNNLNNYKSIIENPFYGGNVFSFFKTSTDPIQISQSEFLDSLINEGSSMITFFGHSSPNSFDFNLDAPQNYENFGRYPLIFSLGCFTGNIYKTDKGLSEEFVLIEDKGAIAFLAATELAQLGALNVWGDRFYRKITTSNYNMGIGDAIQATIEELDNTGFSTRRLNQLMVLHGDPAVKLNTTDAPDYLVKGSDLSFEPSLITTSLDSVSISMTVTNIGRATADSCTLILERTLPDGTVLTPIEERIRAPYFEDTYTFSIPVRNDALGLNQFCIRIDSDDEIEEGPLPFAENNNSFCVNQFILSDDILPVFPTDFAIVPNNSINLKASTTNSFSGEFEYFLEIDTTGNFNSPIKRNTTIIQGGGLLEWTPELTLQDSTVYYWRVQVNPDQVPNSAGWKTQSFTFIENESPGWSQSDHYQFLKNDLSNITYNESRVFNYIDDFLELTVDLSYPGVLVNDQIAFYINGSKETSLTALRTMTRSTVKMAMTPCTVTMVMTCSFP